MSLRVHLLAALAILAGCVAPPSQPTEPAPPPCTDPCERAIAAGDAFEPWVVADPDDADRLLAADTPFRGGVRHLRLHVSLDGGATWASALPDILGKGPLAGCDQVVDPQVAFLPGGGMVATAIALRGDLARQLFSLVSLDGGRTWQGPHAVEPAAGGGCSARSIPDFDRLVALPDGRLLLSWRHLELKGDLVTYGESGIGFATSTDGVSWSAPSTLLVTGHPLCLRANVGPIPLALPDGSVLFAVQYWPTLGRFLCTVHSQDLRTGTATFLGEVALAWPDLALQGGDAVLLSALPGERETPAVWRSADQGATWSGPVRLEELASGGSTTPSLAADGAGNLWLTSFRESGGAWSYWGARLEGDTLQGLERLDRTPIGGHSLGLQGMGHYMGLAGLPDGAYAAWVAGPEGNRTLVGARLG